MTTALADLFEVKEQRALRQRALHVVVEPNALTFSGVRNKVSRRSSVRCDPNPTSIVDDRVMWRVDVAAGGPAELCLEIAGGVGAEDIAPRFHCDSSRDEPPAAVLTGWPAQVPGIETADARLSRAFQRTADDLGSLRLVGPDLPEDVIVVAGALWYMTLFGRDALLTAYHTHRHRSRRPRR